MLEFYTVRKSKSRKQRKCSLCGEIIDIGERYTRYSGKYDGDFFDEKYHISCYNLIDEYCNQSIDNEYDEDWVNDWIVDTVCADCSKRHDDTCTENPFRCQKVLNTLNCKEATDDATD